MGASGRRGGFWPAPLTAGGVKGGLCGGFPFRGLGGSSGRWGPVGLGLSLHWRWLLLVGQGVLVSPSQGLLPLHSPAGSSLGLSLGVVFVGLLGSWGLLDCLVAWL